MVICYFPFPFILALCHPTLALRDNAKHLLLKARENLFSRGSEEKEPEDTNRKNKGIKKVFVRKNNCEVEMRKPLFF